MSLLHEIIRKHALKNAFEYGKTAPNLIIGKVINEFPEAKRNINSVMELAQEICSQINAMEKDAIKAEMSSYSYPEKKEEKKEIELPEAIEGKVVTRFPPEPSGYLHIGHAKAAFLDYQAARRYNGKFLLRFDDTNPEKESKEFVDAAISDLSWLGIIPDQIIFASDMMEKFYEYACKIISVNRAYVCTCKKEEIKQRRFEKKECPCRSRTENENQNLFSEMVAGNIAEGFASVRFVGDMSSQNTAMRDPTLLRIVSSPHYRHGKKYSVWPSYDFEVCIADSLTGVTHAMRSKEYELRDELYFAILDALGLRKPLLVEFSRLNITGMPLSKRLITPLINEGKVEGYDDFRLPTLRGLARRGILPEAIKSFVLSFGLSKVESSPTIDSLLSENKKLIDKSARRLFFVKNPVKVEVEKQPRHDFAVIRNHPTEPMGERKIKVGSYFYISDADAELLSVGSLFRLKGLYNLEVAMISKSKNTLYCKYAGSEVAACPKIQWVSDDYLKCKIKIPLPLFTPQGRFNEENLRVDEGYCEPECSNLSVGSIIQFERYGFVRLDKKTPEALEFIFIST